MNNRSALLSPSPKGMAKADRITDHLLKHLAADPATILGVFRTFVELALESGLETLDAVDFLCAELLTRLKSKD